MIPDLPALTPAAGFPGEWRWRFYTRMGTSGPIPWIGLEQQVERKWLGGFRWVERANSPGQSRWCATQCIKDYKRHNSAIFAIVPAVKE